MQVTFSLLAAVAFVYAPCADHDQPALRSWSALFAILPAIFITTLLSDK